MSRKTGAGQVSRVSSLRAMLRRSWQADEKKVERVKAACGCAITVRAGHTLEERTGFHLNQRPQCKRRVQRAVSERRI